MVAVAFDNLQKAEFAGFPFPASEITVTGGLRDHVHEYPHSPGGAPEKLGRKLYEFSFKVPCYQGLKGYPNLWPETLQSLRIIFEGGRSFDLVVPTIGTITAYCTSWKEVANPHMARNGVEAEWVFREDASDLFLVTELVTKTTANYQSAVTAYSVTLTQQLGSTNAALLQVDLPDPVMLTTIDASDLALFTHVLNDATALVGLLDTVLDIGSQVVALATGVALLCESVDANATSLQDPIRWPLLYALQGVWRAAQQLAADAQNTGVTVVEYVVPVAMPVTAISVAIFGDASQAITIMQTNALPNPYAVAAGTVIKAYLFNASTSIAAAS